MNMRKFIAHPSSFIVVLAVCCANPAPPSHAVRRIVSLAPNVTEMIYAAGCGAKIVGTDSFSDYPDPVKRLPKVGGVEPDIEKIAALHPDLVIASSSNAHPNLRRALAAAHAQLLIVKTDRLSEIAPAIASIQRAADCNANVTLAADLERQRRQRAHRPRIMFAAWTNPLYVAGTGTFMDDLIELTGAQNAVIGQGWPQESLETFAENPPDLLLYPNHSVTPEAVADLLRRARVKVETVPVEENVFSRPGPRVVLAATELNRILDQWERSH